MDLRFDDKVEKVRRGDDLRPRRRAVAPVHGVVWPTEGLSGDFAAASIVIVPVSRGVRAGQPAAASVRALTFTSSCARCRDTLPPAITTARSASWTTSS